jgi:hypothetical protein
MPKNISKNLVSPARELVQKTHDVGLQRGALPSVRLAGQELLNAETLKAQELQDVANAAKSTGPRPTIYNVNSGEWEEVMPEFGRVMQIPIGPPNPSVLNRMWREKGSSDPYWHGVNEYGSPVA